MKIDRRHALALLGSGAAVLPGAAFGQPARSATFVHGVASGDPAVDGAVLWTRATPREAGSAADIRLDWHVALAADGPPVASGRAVARAARDHTVKVEPRGLAAGRDHWFWFTAADGARSPTGRFRTLPKGATPDAVFAVASCSLYGGGLFNAYRAIADLDRVDAVVHLGDYIYEYATEGYGKEIAERLGRRADPDREIVTLADYRRRHAQYRSDPDLQAAHARAAFICVWDDHESANDGWVDGAENHDAGEGDWGARKAAAIQAYFEWMPIRDPRSGGTGTAAIQRTFEFGDLASLFMVETRLLARDVQVRFKGETAAPEDYPAVLAERARPERELLGRDQARWLERGLAASVVARKPWQVIGNQVVMARVAGPDLERSLGAGRLAAALAAVPARWRDRLAASARAYRAGIPFNLDSWDGYPAARERLYASFRRAGARPLVLSGDSHAFWANDLRDASGALVAAEFGTTAITSPSYGAVLPDLGRWLAEANAEVAFCDQRAKGFALLTLTPERARCDLVAVSTITAKPFTTGTVARYEVLASPRGPLRALA